MMPEIQWFNVFQSFVEWGSMHWNGRRVEGHLDLDLEKFFDVESRGSHGSRGSFGEIFCFSQSIWLQSRDFPNLSRRSGNDGHVW